MNLLLKALLKSKGASEIYDNVRKLSTSASRSIIVKAVQGLCCPIVPDAVKIMPLTCRDTPMVIEHLRSNFFLDDPLMKALRIHGRNCILEDIAEKQIVQGLSMCAVSEFNHAKIYGVILNHVACPWDADRTDLYANCIKCCQTRKLVHFYAHVKRKAALHERNAELQLFEMSLLSVDSCVRRLGIAESLVRTSLELARDMGFKLAYMNCSSNYAAQLACKLGMQLSWHMPYTMYLDCDHRPMIYPMPPHDEMQVFTECLRPNNRKDVKKTYLKCHQQTKTKTKCK